MRSIDLVAPGFICAYWFTSQFSHFTFGWRNTSSNPRFRYSLGAILPDKFNFKLTNTCVNHCQYLRNS